MSRFNRMIDNWTSYRYYHQNQMIQTRIISQRKALAGDK